jgi:hypothetical protein
MFDAWGFPQLSESAQAFIRSAYGVLMMATLLQAVPHARRFFLSERWGGYGERGPLVDWVQNPVALPVVLTVWFASALALAIGWAVVPAALANALLCRYFFIHMRWRGVLRGMGAPGFIAQWLGVAVAVLEWSARHAPGAHGLALLVIQVDFAFIMLSAGVYKFVAGYRTGNGMELGMVNPEWGYWWPFWGRQRTDAWWFRLFNQLAWSTEVVAAVLMVVPQTRLLGGLLILVSFVFIASQIRLGFLCEMVMVGCLFFVPAGSGVDGWLRAVSGAAPTAVAPAPVPAAAASLLAAALWFYLAALPFAHAGLSYNLYLKRRLPGALQRLLEQYTNTFGLIVWRVFSADHTNFFVEIEERKVDGTRRLVSAWGHGLRFGHVAESITVTTLFTTLKYYPSQRDVFVDRLLRYARTVPRAPGSLLAFRYVGIVKRDGDFEHVPAAEYLVNVERGTVDERVLDDSVPVRGLVAESPVHEAVRPGSYAPASS